MTREPRHQVPLSVLLRGYSTHPLPKHAVNKLTTCSSEAGPGVVFFAQPGTQTDGRHFIAQALAQQATAVVFEAAGADPVWLNHPQHAGVGTCLVPVRHLQQHVASVAARFYGHPGQKLGAVYAVTGTNGKSSIAHFIAQLSEGLGEPCSVIGTLGAGKPGALVPLGMTTPSPIRLQSLLADFVEDGYRAVALEASSHALSQHRLHPEDISCAIFSQLSHDHLDYHGNMEAYGRAKARLFHYPSLKHIVLNGDDPFAERLLASQPHHQSLDWVSKRRPADDQRLRWIQILDVISELDGIIVRFKVLGEEHEVKLPLLGAFNAYNALLAATAVRAHTGATWQAVVSGMMALKSVPGRMEMMICDGAPRVVVDYAHTPDALYHVLASLRAMTSDALWCVFGCGGDRDRSKRGPMTQVASQGADFVIMTSDNPRGEPLERIFDDMRDGLVAGVRHWCIVDRQEAIHFALRQASPLDVVLIAGKGHEDEQVIGAQRVVLSDRNVVQEYFAS